MCIGKKLFVIATFHLLLCRASSGEDVQSRILAWKSQQKGSLTAKEVRNSTNESGQKASESFDSTLVSTLIFELIILKEAACDNAPKRRGYKYVLTMTQSQFGRRATCIGMIFIFIFNILGDEQLAKKCDILQQKLELLLKTLTSEQIDAQQLTNLVDESSHGSRNVEDTDSEISFDKTKTEKVEKDLSNFNFRKHRRTSR